VQALLDIKAAFSGWDASMQQYGIRLRGWQALDDATSTGNSGSIGGTHNRSAAGPQAAYPDPCTWSFVQECDSDGRIMRL